MADSTTDANKRQKLEGGDINQKFSDFEVCKVLGDYAKTKTFFLHGKLGGEDAVVLLDKKPFNAAEAMEIVSQRSHFTETLNNDIYSTYEVQPPSELNALKMTLIHPATSKHIAKYTDQDMFVIEETSDLYNAVTLPYITQQNFSIQWVYNILDKKSESERIVYEDTDEDQGFILLPDMKWDRKDVNSLYLVAIVHTKGLKSLRDLTTAHLPLLKNILTKGKEEIQKQFLVPGSKLRIYIHYQPSYYHLHVHFTHIKLDIAGFEADRAHMLLDVIENIELMSDYYSKKTLVHKVRENDGLYKAYSSAGYFDKTSNME